MVALTEARRVTTLDGMEPDYVTELREVQEQILQAYQDWWAEWNKGMDYLAEWGDRLLAETKAAER